MLSRILVPFEFSARCHGAVQYAEALARHFKSEIVLLHVVTPPNVYFGGFDAAAWYSSDQLAEDLVPERQHRLDALPCGGGEGVRGVRRVVCIGDPAARIVEAAALENSDLIVMPTHGYGPFRRFLLGSVTAKVLHDAICPVWTGPHLENAPDPSALGIGRVLCAVDLGPQTRRTLCWAARFAAEYGATLRIVHAIAPVETRLGPLCFDPEWRSTLAADAREHIENVAHDLGAQPEIVIASGEVAQAVCESARESSASVVVIGRGKSANAHCRLPAQVYAIARQSPCPVVSV